MTSSGWAQILRRGLRMTSRGVAQDDNSSGNGLMDAEGIFMDTL